MLIRAIEYQLLKEKLTPIDSTEDLLLGQGHIHLGKEISLEFCEKIIIVLRNYQNAFIWEGKTPTHVDQCITSHKLNITSTFPPQCQKH